MSTLRGSGNIVVLAGQPYDERAESTDFRKSPADKSVIALSSFSPPAVMMTGTKFASRKQELMTDDPTVVDPPEMTVLVQLASLVPV
jgi:hypothetical protein